MYFKHKNTHTLSQEFRFQGFSQRQQSPGAPGQVPGLISVQLALHQDDG